MGGHERLEARVSRGIGEREQEMDLVANAGQNVPQERTGTACAWLLHAPAAACARVPRRWSSLLAVHRKRP